MSEALCDIKHNLAYNKEMLAFTDKEKQEQRYAAYLLQKKINDAIKNGEKEFIIKKGYYRFGADNAKTLCISNAENMTVLAEKDVHILQEKADTPLVNVENCKNTTIEGFTLDLDPINFIQGEIVKVDYDNKTVDFKPDDGFVIPENVVRTKLRVIFFNKDGTRFIPNWYNDLTFGIDELDDGLVRISLELGLSLTPGLGLVPGCKTVIPFRGNEATMWTLNCEECTFKNIEIYGSYGFALGEKWGYGNVYDGVKIIPRPKTGRMWVTGMDGFHSKFGTKGPTLVNCEFSHTEDDLVNIHGKLDLVYEVIDKTHLYIVATQDVDFKEGSYLRFFSIDNMENLGEAKILSLTKPDDTLAHKGDELPKKLLNEHTIRMRGDIKNTTMYLAHLDRPVDAKACDLVECAQYGTPGAIIRNCYFHHGHVRGILLRSTGAIVENNKFEEIQGPSVLINTETYWMEGPFPKDVIIRNNDIVRCSIGIEAVVSTPGAVAVFVGVASDRPETFKTQVYENIKIHNNFIENSGAGGVLIMHAKNCSVSGNTIKKPWSFELGIDYDRGQGKETRLQNPFGAILLEACKDIQIGENIIEGLPRGICEVVYEAAKKA